MSRRMRRAPAWVLAAGMVLGSASVASAGVTEFTGFAGTLASRAFMGGPGRASYYGYSVIHPPVSSGVGMSSGRFRPRMGMGYDASPYRSYAPSPYGYGTGYYHSPYLGTSSYNNGYHRSRATLGTGYDVGVGARSPYLGPSGYSTGVYRGRRSIMGPGYDVGVR